jgi:glucokinase
MRGIGIDLGGSKLLACLTDEDGRVLGRAVRTTGRATGPLEACRLIREVASELCEAGGPFEVAGVGFPGQVDFARGVARASVMLDGWREVPLAGWVGEALGLPCVVDNDVNAAAVAELKHRHNELPGSMLFVAVGTGIGGAIVLENRLWRGHTGVAGEIGNVTIDRHGPKCWCGRRGCLNTSASGAAIERQLEPGVPLAEQVRLGNPRLDDVLDDAAESLGIGIANALNLLNPALVVLGGGVAELGERWLDKVAAAARAETFPEAGECRFELARAGYQAGAVGAALLGFEKVRSVAPGYLITTTASQAAPAALTALSDPAPFGDHQAVP